MCLCTTTGQITARREERHPSVSSSPALAVCAHWGHILGEGTGRQGGKPVEGGKGEKKKPNPKQRKGGSERDGGGVSAPVSHALKSSGCAQRILCGGRVSLKAVGGWSWGSAHSSMYNTAVLCLCLGYNKKAIKCEMS